jgi:hypothetical protein
MEIRLCGFIAGWTAGAGQRFRLRTLMALGQRSYSDEPARKSRVRDSWGKAGSPATSMRSPSPLSSVHTKVRLWTRSQRIRTVASLQLIVPLIHPKPPPLYQTIGSKAVHLWELGLTNAAIARRLGVTGKTVAKAIAWTRDGGTSAT